MKETIHVHRLIFTSIKCFASPYRPPTIEPRTLRHYMLARITAGQGVVVIDQIPYHIQPRDWLFFEPGTAVTFYTDGGQACHVEGVLFRSYYAQRRSDSDWRLTRPVMRLPHVIDDASFPPTAAETWKAIHHRHADRLLQHDALRHLLHNIQQIPHVPSKYGLSHAITYMQHNYDADIRIKDVARQSGFSLNHFIRLFKQHFKQTPGQYLQQIRMHKAKQLLLGANKIKEIAHLTGFRDEHYFSRAFKKTVGMAPGHFLKHAHGRVAVRYYGLEDYLTTLGIQPLTRLSYRERVARWHEIPELERLCAQAVPLSSTQSNYERLRQLAPDVILTSDRLAPESALEDIAPTSVVPYSSDPESTLRHLGRLFGQEQAVDRWLSHYEAERTRSRQFIQERWGKPYAGFLRILPHGYRLYGPQSQVGHLLYQLLACELPPILQPHDWAIELTVDQLASASIDHLFMMTDPIAQAQRWRDDLLASKQWHELSAVIAGRIYPADDLFFKTLGPSGQCWSMAFARWQFAK